MVTGMIIYYVQKQNKYVVVYEAGEEDITTSQQMFWLLKNNHLNPKYSAPIDWISTMTFHNSPITITISVLEKDVGKAQNLIMNYNTEQRKLERNIVNERNKTTM
ncbi:hypothetical protein [Ornithinibacillus halotolerans]|nr:hypothetical protein [Ornithinibacillus halotolerans]